MDVLLFVVICAAAVVHVLCLRGWMRQHEGIGVGLLLRLAGWSVLAARFGAVLFSDGDIPVSVPAAIGLFFLASGDIIGMLFRGRKP